MTMLPTWVLWTQALAVPVIALAGVIVAASNLWLAYRKRRDELFDRRYEFFRRMVSAWESAIVTSDDTGELVPEWDDRLIFAQEARFLFGDDVADHLASYEKPFNYNFSYLTNDDFVKPFERYLRLGR